MERWNLRKHKEVGGDSRKVGKEEAAVAEKCVENSVWKAGLGRVYYAPFYNADTTLDSRRPGDCNCCILSAFVTSGPVYALLTAD